MEELGIRVSKRGLHPVGKGLERHHFPSERQGTSSCLGLEERFCDLISRAANPECRLISPSVSVLYLGDGQRIQSQEFSPDGHFWRGPCLVHLFWGSCLGNPPSLHAFRWSVVYEYVTEPCKRQSAQPRLQLTLELHGLTWRLSIASQLEIWVKRRGCWCCTCTQRSTAYFQQGKITAVLLSLLGSAPHAPHHPIQPTQPLHNPHNLQNLTQHMALSAGWWSASGPAEAITLVQPCRSCYASLCQHERR